MKHLLSYFVIIVLASTSLAAAQRPSESSVSLYHLYLNFNAASSDVMALKKTPNQKKTEQSFKGPEEPIVPKVTFYEFDKPSHLHGKAESLVHGVVIGLPPEYDHYGYEIRRYMNSIGNFDIYINQNTLQKEMLNVSKAEIVFKYWRKKLDEDLNALNKQIETLGADAKTLTTFRLNKGHIQTFLVEAQSWINANKAFLAFIKENQGQFRFKENELIFQSDSVKNAFVNLYAAKEKAKYRMQQYDPFREIVY